MSYRYIVENLSDTRSPTVNANRERLGMTQFRSGKMQMKIYQGKRYKNARSCNEIILKFNYSTHHRTLTLLYSVSTQDVAPMTYNETVVLAQLATQSNRR